MKQSGSQTGRLNGRAGRSFERESGTQEQKIRRGRQQKHGKTFLHEVRTVLTNEKHRDLFLNKDKGGVVHLKRAIERFLMKVGLAINNDGDHT